MKELVFERIEFKDVPEDEDVPYDFRLSLYIFVTIQDLLSEYTDNADKCIGEPEFGKIYQFVVDNLPKGDEDTSYFEQYIPPLKIPCGEYAVHVYYLNGSWGIGIFRKED
ncbi:MAG: hypothetical protein QW607_05865 [Desulfurococcaceae archaeon]